MSERKRFPTPITFPTPEQIDHSLVRISDKPRKSRLVSLLPRAKDVRKDWLEENLHLGVLPNREQNELQRLQSEDGKKAK